MPHEEIDDLFNKLINFCELSDAEILKVRGFASKRYEHSCQCEECIFFVHDNCFDPDMLPDDEDYDPNNGLGECRAARITVNMYDAKCVFFSSVLDHYDECQ